MEPQKTQSAADDKESAPKAQGTEWNGSVFTLLLSQNKTYHVAATQVSQFVSKMRRRKALLKTISIQQKGFLGPNEYLLD
jgi:hypothetical protein